MLRKAIRRTRNPGPATAAALPLRWSSSSNAIAATDAQVQAPKAALPMKDDTLKESRTGGSKPKTMAELDEEMRAKMSGLSGDGGEAGIEYEDGKPVAMKRSVKNNMFRYI